MSAELVGEVAPDRPPPVISRTRRVLEGLGATYLSFVVKAGIKLLVTPFYLGRLGPELMGFNSFIGETMSYLQLMDLGIGTSLTAVVARDSQPGASRPEQEVVRRKLRAGGQLQLVAACITLLISLVVAFLLEDLAQGLSPDHLAMARVCTVLFGFSIALYLASGVYKSVLIGKQLVGQNALYGIFSTVLAAVVGVGLVAFGWSLYGLATAAVASAVAFSLQARWRSHRLGTRLQLLRGPIEGTALAEVGRLSGWVLLASVGGLLGFSSARVILGLLPSQGMAAVNKYALLVAVPTMIRLQANRISVVVRPGLTQLTHANQGGHRARHVARLLVRSTGLLGALALVGIWSVNGSFVSRWVGSNFYAGDSANRLVALLIGLSVWIFGFKVLMEVRFDYRRRGIAFFVAGALTASLSLVLAPVWGLEGVLVAAIIGEVVVAALWFVPAGFRWLVADDARFGNAVSLFAVPVVVAVGGLAIVSVMPPVAVSWGAIVGRSASILVAVCVVGWLWLGKDFRALVVRR